MSVTAGRFLGSIPGAHAGMGVVCLCVWMYSASPHSTPKSRGTVWEESSANEDLKKQHLFIVLEEGDGRGENKIRIS